MSKKLFANPPLPSLSRSLKKILIVSNHAPTEVIQAMLILQQQGYVVQHIGLNSNNNQELISPKIIHEFDCIVSIGKTVQYAILSNKAVYCYDHFGGIGYLKQDNYNIAKYYNFSGRGFDEYKNAKQIAFEIVNGFNDSLDFISKLTDKDDYILDINIEKLLTLPKITITTEQQSLIKLSYPIEENLSRQYNYCRNLEHQNQEQLKTYKKKKKKYTNTIHVLLIVIFILSYQAIK